MKTRVSGLRELARLYGVETAYEGMGGGKRRAETDALLHTLRALGAPLDDDSSPRAALRARRAELDALAIQPVHVAWAGSLRELRVRLPTDASGAAVVEFRLESGEVIVQQCEAQPARLRPRSGWRPTHRIPLGRRLPIGYHRVEVETAGSTFDTFVIAAPRRAWAPGNVREWGVFCPLYALCSDGSQGIGDYSDLGTMARWVGDLGGDFVSTLPLLASFLDAPFEPSPYSPASRLFWNELFVDVAAAPGGGAVGAAAPGSGSATGVGTSGASRDRPEQAGFDECRPGSLVDYHPVAALKRRALQHAMTEAAGDPAVQAELRQFEGAFPRMADYARFRAVCDRRREGWTAWPERLRNGTLREGDFAPEDYDYHVFAQWQADRQLGAVAAAVADGAAALYLDMPLGVNVDGYDAWRFRELFAEGVSAGAPPDPLFTGGQNWGFRPLSPPALRATGYQYLIDVFRHHLRHARMLRLDHVMSLYRLFWVPEGMSAQQGVYVRYAEDELFALLVLESARHRAVVIGEDLGTVPPAVRRAMDRHHVPRMHVLQFEASPDSDPPVQPPPENVVASLNTHDMPTFAGFWRGSEIDDQLELGLIDSSEHENALARRALLRERLSRSLGAGGEVEPGLARQRLLERLAAAPARYLLINLEDLWLEEQPQNVPGTSDERPNWKRRASRSLNDITRDAAIRRMLESIAMRRSQAQQTHTDSDG